MAKYVGKITKKERGGKSPQNDQKIKEKTGKNEITAFFPDFSNFPGVNP